MEVTVKIYDQRGSKGASGPNRRRFLDKVRQYRRRIVDEVLERDKIITNPDGEQKVSIPVDDIGEPHIRKENSGGDHHRVLPGNKEFATGDRISRPTRGGGDGSGEGSGNGEGVDPFHFILSSEEFRALFFEDCELPNMRKRGGGVVDSFSLRRAGFSRSGAPAQMDLVRTFRQSLARRIALQRPTYEDLVSLEAAIRAEEEKDDESELLQQLREEHERLRERRADIPYIEPSLDVRYRRFEKSPIYIARAVMFCLMDVSGSMTQERKNCAKRFFLLLSLFLRSNYTHVDVVFIRHTDRAEEVDEETFFHSRDTGGTVVSSALEKMKQVVSQRYSSGWNIYGAQASDGDDFDRDTAIAVSLLEELLPALQYYAYIEVKEDGSPSTLWDAYEQIKSEQFAMRRVEHPEDVWPVFHDLFRRTAHT